jgi:hypothetical protein
MNKVLKALAFGTMSLGLLALGACDPAKKAEPTPAAAVDPNAPRPAFTPDPPMTTTLYVDWVMFARGPAATSTVFYAPTTRGTGADGTRYVWVQIQHNSDQVWEGDQKMIYRLERAFYGFKCADRTYNVLQRQVINGNGDKIAGVNVAATWNADAVRAAEYKEFGGSGTAAVLYGIMCPQKPI